MTTKTEAPEPKRRRTIDEQIRALEAKKERQQITSAVGEAVKTLRSEVRSKRWTDARTTIAILDRALADLEKANGHG